jgi:hypothetical protein
VKRIHSKKDTSFNFVCKGAGKHPHTPQPLLQSYNKYVLRAPQSTDSVFGGRNYCSPVGSLDRLSALSYPSACFIGSRTVEIADCGCGERVCFAKMNQALNPEGIVDP